MIVFEDNMLTDKLKIYPKGFGNHNTTLQEFESECEFIYFENTKPLIAEQKHFFDSIINNIRPFTDGVYAIEVL